MNTMIPVRCYTCGKVLGNLGDRYENLLEEGNTTEEAMDKLGLIRYCCRMNLFNPYVLPRNAFDHSKAFIDMTHPKASIISSVPSMDERTSVGKINLAYHTIVPGELKLPLAGKPKSIAPDSDEIFLDDLAPPRRVPTEEIKTEQKR